MSEYNPYNAYGNGHPFMQADGSYSFPQASPGVLSSTPSAPFGSGYLQANVNGTSAFGGNSPGGYQQPPATMSPAAMSINPLMLQQPPPSRSAPSQPVASTSQQAMDPRMLLQPAAGPSKSNPAKDTLAATTHLAVSPENVQWNRAYPELKKELDKQRIAKSPLRAGKRIVEMLKAFDGGRDVPVAGRKEVLVVMTSRPPPPADFFQALVDNGGIEIIERWLREAVAAHKGKANGDKADEQLRPTLSSVLRVLDILPITVTLLRDSKLGLVIKNISQDAKAKAAEQKYAKPAHELAGILMTKWSTMIKSASSQSNPPPAEAKKPAKRVEPPSEDPARKKAKLDQPVVKIKTVTVDARAAKSGSPSTAGADAGLSFLSSSKPNAGLKALSVPRKKSAAVAQTAKESTPPIVTPVASTSATTPTVKSGFAAALSAIQPKEMSSNLADPSRRNKKKRSVHWPEDDRDLEKVKIFETYLEEGGDEHDKFTAADARQLDVNEGQRFVRHVEDNMEEEVEWSEPQNVLIPPSKDGDAIMDRPTYPDPASLTVYSRSEADIQAERERTTPPSSYGDGNAPPLSAIEPSSSNEPIAAPKDIPLPAVFAAMPAVQQALHYMASNDYSIPSGNPADYIQSNQELNALMSVLNPAAGAVPTPQQPVSGNTDAMALLQGLGADGLQNLLRANGLPSSNEVPVASNRQWGSAAPVPTSSFDPNSLSALTALQSLVGPTRTTGWGAPAADDGPPVPRRRIAKPYAGKKRIPCKFFKRGDCREGDDCTFSHDQ